MESRYGAPFFSDRAAALCLLGLGQSSVFCAYLARAAYRDDPND